MALAPPGDAASYPPWLHFQTISTPRVSVHFHQGFELQARKAATLATELLDAYETRYGHFICERPKPDPLEYALEHGEETPEE